MEDGCDVTTFMSSMRMLFMLFMFNENEYNYFYNLQKKQINKC